MTETSLVEVLAGALVGFGPVELPRGRAVRRVALGGLVSVRSSPATHRVSS